MIKKYLITFVFLFVLYANSKAQTIVTFYTNMGNFEVELFDTLMPITAGNIKSLVNNKFYDGVIFHRIIKSFVIQGGDPTGIGNGGPGYSILDEFHPDLSNLKKTLSMANSGPNTGGSQFFINTVNNTFLDSKHPVFGVVISGWDTVVSIESVAVNSSDRPLTDVIMDSVRVTQFPVGLFTPNLAKMDVRIFPNPVNSNSVVEMISEKSQMGEFSLFNQNGTRIKSRMKLIERGVSQFELMSLGVSSLPTGIYSLRITFDGKFLTKRFIVTK